MQATGGHLKIVRNFDLHTVRVQHDSGAGFDDFLNRLHARPHARKAAQGEGVQAQIQYLLHCGRKEHRRAAGFENVVTLVRGGRAFGHMVVARHRNHAAPFGGASHVGVFENIAAAVHSGAFAVPQAKDAIELVAARRRKPELLRTPQGGGRQLFVDTGLKNNVVRLQVALGFDQRLVQAAQRRATVAADEAGGVFASHLIPQALQHWQPDQRLHPAHERRAVVQGVFIIQRNRFKAAVLGSGVRCVHDASPPTIGQGPRQSVCLQRTVVSQITSALGCPTLPHHLRLLQHQFHRRILQIGRVFVLAQNALDH